MLARLKTFSLLGIEAIPVDIEVDVSPAAVPKTILVGLPEKAAKESTHRVARAIVNSGNMRPQDRVVINMAPAELPKQAASFDLPITLGTLASSSGQFVSDLFDAYAVVGELSLEGNTRSTKGALSMAISAAKDPGLRGLVVPASSVGEAAVVEDIDVIAVTRWHKLSASSPDNSILPQRRRGSIGSSRNMPFTMKTTPTYAGKRWPSERSLSPPVVVTICSCWNRLVVGKPCT
jgi:predicted ATPase with chaperone activity